MNCYTRYMWWTLWACVSRLLKLLRTPLQAGVKEEVRWQNGENQKVQHIPWKLLSTNPKSLILSWDQPLIQTSNLALYTIIWTLVHLQRSRPLTWNVRTIKYCKSTNSKDTLLEIQFCRASFHIAITVKFEEKQSFRINGSSLTELNRLLQRATGSLNKWW